MTRAKVTRRVLLLLAVALPRCDSDPASDDGAAPGDAALDDGSGADAEVDRVCLALKAHPILACARPESGTAGTDISGTVEEIARGYWDCYGIGGSGSQFGDRPWRFRVSDGVRSVWVGVMLPWYSPLVRVGDEVAVEYSFEDPVHGNERGHLLILQNGSPLLWVGHDDSTERLAPPAPLTVRDADDACVADNSCETLAKRGFVVSDGTHSVTMAYGGQADIGDYAVLHAGNVEQLSTRCYDSFIDEAAVVAVRGSLQALAEGDRPACGGSVCPAGEYCELPTTVACSASATEGGCAQAPPQCTQDCAGVCGCDGRFYCNACWAARAGYDVAEQDDTCKSAGCEGPSTGAGDGGDCSVFWSCFGRQYGVDCKPETSGFSCACSVDGLVVHSFQSDDAVSCAALDTAHSCGFPEAAYQP